MSFLKRNLACLRAALLTQLEYRFNLIADSCLQPLFTAGMELTLWVAVLKSAGGTLGGFGLSYYLTYAGWAAFFARISAPWQHEMRMIDEIHSGGVNSLLTRPISFYEYYLSQFVGQKFIATLVSLSLPVSAFLFISSTTHFARLPVVLILASFYLILAHTLCFTIACFGFFFNKVHAFTIAKNFALCIFTGELLPLDLFSEHYRNFILKLPFASAVYIPVGYLTGRIEFEAVLWAFVKVGAALVIVGISGALLWRKGQVQYSGSGA